MSLHDFSRIQREMLSGHSVKQVRSAVAAHESVLYTDKSFHAVTAVGDSFTKFDVLLSLNCSDKECGSACVYAYEKKTSAGQLINFCDPYSFSLCFFITYSTCKFVHYRVMSLFFLE